MTITDGTDGMRVNYSFKNGTVLISSGLEANLNQSVASAIEAVTTGFKWGAVGRSVTSVSDLYNRGLHEIRIEPMTGAILEKFNGQATGINLVRKNNTLGDLYYDGNLTPQTNTGVDTIYLNVASAKSTADIAKSIMHEILHEDKFINEYGARAAREIIRLVESGAVSSAILPNEIDISTLTELAEHAQIAYIVDIASQNSGLGAYDRRELLTGAVQYYLNSGIAIGVPGQSYSTSDARAAVKLGFEPDAERPYLPDGEKDGVILPIAVESGGSIALYINEQGNIVEVIGSGNYTQLEFYSVEHVDRNGRVTASYSLGATVRGIADLLGFDGGGGIDGSFRKPWEGKGGVPGSDRRETPDGRRDGLAPDTSPRPRTRSDGDSDSRNGSSQGSGDFMNDLRDFGRSLGNALGLNPVLLDLDGNGVQIVDLSRSTRFIAGEDGLQHRTAWAGAGDGVLFYDVGNDGKISDSREYVFTEWAPGATDDMAALRAVFDANGDGKLSGAELAGFKVMVTNADGTTSVKTLGTGAGQLNITEINLLPDTTKITLPDGSTITGQSSFVMGGTTRTAANVTLMAEAQGYRTVQTSTLDSSGARVIKTTGYAANGDKAFVMVQTTSADGLTVTSTYDSDGDGVVDQIQTAVTAINPTTQARTETLTNLRGADAATAVLLSRVVTVTSADGKSVTVSHDHAGGGWFDQVETRVTNADGSRLVTITDKAQNGTVIAQSSETIWANGLTQVRNINEDGDGDSDVVVTEVISTSAGVRTESVVTRNGSAAGTIRSAETVVISADGLTRTVTEDIGGGDAAEFTTVEVTSVVAGGRQVERTVRNADTSQRLREVTVISADALTVVTAQEIDAVAGVDRRVTDATTVASDGTRVRTVTQTSGDGSVLGMQRTVLGADQVSAETWEDLNRDGVFAASDLVRSVVVDEATGARTATAWQRSAGGDVLGQTTEVTSSNGLSTTRTVDADGDGATDRSVTDTTVLNGDQSATRTVTEKAADGTVISKATSTGSSDGLVTITATDSGGSAAIESLTIDLWEGAASGARLHHVSTFAGDGRVLLSQVTTEESANRLQTKVRTDSDGDGVIDDEVTTAVTAGGVRTVTHVTRNANGDLTSESVSVVSANGLVTDRTEDANGDGADETMVHDETVIASSGHRTQTITTSNGDGSLRSREVTTVTGDGWGRTVKTDADGDGTYETQVSVNKAVLANGATEETTATMTSTGQVLTRRVVTTSDDGLVVTETIDGDNDGDIDRITTSTTVLAANGDRTTTVVVGVNAVGGVPSQVLSTTTTAVTNHGRTTTVTEDVNGDRSANVPNQDIVTTTEVALSGTVTETGNHYSRDGQIDSVSRRVTSGDGLTIWMQQDRDGDGIYEHTTWEDTVLEADGDRTRRVEERDQGNRVLSAEVVTQSADGWTTETFSDLDGPLHELLP